LEVDVWSVDAEMSGTAILEIGFDTAATGTFDAKAPPVKAERKTPPYWTAKLPTKDLSPGAATLLVRATDRVGNVGDITKVRLEVVSAADAAAMKAAGSRIAGTVRYGGSPVAGARVVLHGADQKEIVAPATTNDAGFFALENVPAGTYQVAVRGLARNKPRTATQPIVVPPPPEKTPRLELELR
jgi:hypothetical protein